MECPKCHSDSVEATNLGIRAISNVCGGIAACVLAAIRQPATFANEYVRKAMCDKANYKCQSCGHEWQLGR